MPMMAIIRRLARRSRRYGALVSTPSGKRKLPLLVTKTTAAAYRFICHGEAGAGECGYRTRIAHRRRSGATAALLVTDTPGPVTVTTPRQVLSDETRVPLRVEVRDREYKPVTDANVQARFLQPDGTS